MEHWSQKGIVPPQQHFCISLAISFYFMLVLISVLVLCVLLLHNILCMFPLHTELWASCVVVERVNEW